MSNQALQSFLHEAQKNALPKGFSPDAQDLLERYFRHMRGRSCEMGSAAASFAPRLLESLLRLAESHARILQHDAVNVEDAVAVIFLHAVSLHSQGVPVEILDAFGTAAPAHLRCTTLSSDITSREDYRSVEGAVFWVLGYDGRRGAVGCRQDGGVCTAAGHRTQEPFDTQEPLSPEKGTRQNKRKRPSDARPES
eukprot:1921862-Amphidinium_carterae.1